jgi:hypothetical protein
VGMPPNKDALMFFSGFLQYNSSNNTFSSNLSALRTSTGE